MKKILSMMGIALLIASCSDDYTDWANPLTNAQEEAKTVTLAIEQADDIDFATLTAETVQLFVPTVTSSTAGVTSYEVAIEGTESVMEADAKGYVNAEELKAAVERYEPRLEDINATMSYVRSERKIYVTITGTIIETKEKYTYETTLKIWN